MLVLSRKLDEAIHLDNDITIVVSQIGPNTVRFAIEAPQSVSIQREELKFSPEVVRERRESRARRRYLRDCRDEGGTDNTAA